MDADTVPQTIAVVAAMFEELAPFLKRQTGLTDARLPQLRAWRGKFRNNCIVNVVTGEGPEAAARSVERLLQVFAPERLILVGVAGALSEDLAVTDVVAAEQVVDLRREDATGELVYQADANWLQKSVDGGAVRKSTCVTQARIATSAEQKQRLGSRWSKEGCSTVDLESAAVAEICAKQKVPWLVLRAVSDTQQESLPDFLASCQRPDGSVNRSAVVRKALLRPKSWPKLVQMKERVDQCAIKLTDTLTALL